MLYFQLWYYFFFIAAICDDMTVRLRRWGCRYSIFSILWILFIWISGFVCHMECGVGRGRGTVNGLDLYRKLFIEIWQQRQTSWHAHFAFSDKKIGMYFCLVFASIFRLFIMSTVNNFIFSLCLHRSIDQLLLRQGYLHCYSFEFIYFFHIMPPKTLNLTNSWK